MKAEVQKITTKVSKAGNEYQAVLGIVVFGEEPDDEKCPIRFEARKGQYKEGDMVELFPSLDYNFHAKVGHRLLVQ